MPAAGIRGRHHLSAVSRSSPKSRGPFPPGETGGIRQSAV